MTVGTDMEKTVFLCEENLHVHTEECMAEGNLICAKADFYVHTHSDICYSEDGSLLCTLAEKELPLFEGDTDILPY